MFHYATLVLMEKQNINKFRMWKNFMSQRNLTCFVLWIGLTSLCFCDDLPHVNEKISKAEDDPVSSEVAPTVIIESEASPVDGEPELLVPSETAPGNRTEARFEGENSANETLEAQVIVVSAANISTGVTNATIKQVTCLQNELSDEPLTVKTVNASMIQMLLQPNKNITERSTPAQCAITLFYASWCPYSVQAAQHFNALPRAFPFFDVIAIDSYKEHSINAIYGVTAVPSIVLFHNGKPAAKYNDTEYSLDLFAAFITKYTNTTPECLLNRTSADMLGPVPTTVEEVFDPLLWLCSVFLLAVSIRTLMKTQLWHNSLESLTNTWREAEAQAQHEHNE